MVKQNSVDKKGVIYDEEVKDFVGLIFHCPECNQEMHLHIAGIYFQPVKIKNEEVKKR